MRKLKVLHIGRYYWPEPGGVERVTKTLCEGLSARGHTVEAWVGHRRPNWSYQIIEGVRVVRFPTLASWQRTPFTTWSGRTLQQFQPDLIHVHAPNLLGSFRLSTTSIPMIITQHSEVASPSWWSKLHLRGIRTLTNQKPFFVFPSDEARTSSPLIDLAPSDRQRVIPVGIDPSWLDGSKGEAVAEGDVVFVGGLFDYKGLDTFIYAMEGVEARALIVGDGPERRRLQHLVRHLGLESKILLIGQRTDHELAQILRQARVFVLPSIQKQESLGTALLEAMAAGLPAISTRIATGVRHYNLHGQTGLMVPPGNVTRLRDAIKRVLSNPHQARQWGQAASQRARTLYGHSSMIEGYERLYEELTGGADLPLPPEPTHSSEDLETTRSPEIVHPL